jgi:hypothetical protein
VTDREVEESVQKMLQMAKADFLKTGRVGVAYMIFTSTLSYFVVNADASKEAFLQVLREQCKELGARGLVGIFKGWSSSMPLGLTVDVKQQPDVQEAVMGVLEDASLGHRLYTAKIAADGSVGDFVMRRMGHVTGMFANVLTPSSDLN